MTANTSAAAASPLDRAPSTGLPALDDVLNGLRWGDNVVWRVDAIDDYVPFVEALCREARARGSKVVYFRFAEHPPVMAEGPGVIVHKLHPDAGFEAFIVEIHRIIQSVGEGGYFVFDSMSDLTNNCYSDRMIGNFFKLTCPYLFRLKTIAYFTILRYHHSYHAASPIADTTQILIDVYDHRGRLYIKPLRVQDRFSPSLYMLYAWEGDRFDPIRESVTISEVLADSFWPGLPSASYRMVGIWDKLFMQADEVLAAVKAGEPQQEKAARTFRQLLRLIISTDESVLALAEKYFTLEDIVQIWKRMIGTGMIGGKSTGMLMARAILRHSGPRWKEVLEEHDSFFIGSDVFYTFLVENDCWMEKQKQKDPSAFLRGIEEVQEKMLRGVFPEYIVTRFSDMLDYFGQSPIIVRSSSLLEDNFGNAFAGKYESVFCANQGTREERLQNLISAVRVVYASAMSVEALSYRKKRGVLEQDEQMALLVQRVSGGPHGRYFFPHLAGVAYSFNSYAWNKQIDPEAGMLRLVFGLGTRAVDRADDDYTRVVALNAPERRPEGNFDAVKRYAQRRVDVLDLESDRFANVYFSDVVPVSGRLPISLFASRDRGPEGYSGQGAGGSWVLTFDNVLTKTNFITDMRAMLETVKEGYGAHVDIEFTTNFLSPDSYRINLLQCRPLQVQPPSAASGPLPEIRAENIVLEVHGAVIGTARTMPVDRLVYVVPAKYGRMSEPDRYAVARVIGELSRLDEKEARSVMLIGPGRWGTGTASLGIPVTSSDIREASVLCEIDTMHEGLVPDLSLGTHFFNEMVEMNMMYVAYFAAMPGNVLNEEVLLRAPNSLAALLPGSAQWADTIRVIEQAAPGDGRKFYLNANTLDQTAVLYLE